MIRPCLPIKFGRFSQIVATTVAISNIVLNITPLRTIVSAENNIELMKVNSKKLASLLILTAIFPRNFNQWKLTFDNFHEPVHTCHGKKVACIGTSIHCSHLDLEQVPDSKFHSHLLSFSVQSYHQEWYIKQGNLQVRQPNSSFFLRFKIYFFVETVLFNMDNECVFCMLGENVVYIAKIWRIGSSIRMIFCLRYFLKKQNETSRE